MGTARRMQLGGRDQRVARAWIEVQRNWWAFDEVQAAIEKQPRRAWRLLVRLADLATTKELARDFGCGPLEDFVRAHAPTTSCGSKRWRRRTRTFAVLCA